MKLSSLLKFFSGGPAGEQSPPASRPADEMSVASGQDPAPPAPEPTPADITALKRELRGTVTSLEQFIETSETDFLTLDTGLRAVHRITI